MSGASEVPAIPEDVRTLATAVAGTFGWGYFQVQARDAIAKAIMLDRAARPVDTGREKALEGWQDISTAPINTRIEIGAWFEDDSGGYFGESCWNWIVSGQIEGVGLWIDVNDDFASQPLAELRGFDKPTHWRPLSDQPPHALANPEKGRG